MEAIAILLKQFETFTRRSLLPSSVFFLIFYLIGLLSSKEQTNQILQYIYTNVLKDLNSILYISTIIIALVGMSFILSILTQAIFDNRIKKNYNSLIPIIGKYENEKLEILRAKSIEKLEKENNSFQGLGYSDFFLYQILGRKLQNITPKTDTKRYVDDTKSAGIIFSSIVISIFIHLIINFNIQIIITWLMIIAIPLFIFWGNEHIKSKYRSRAFRIYINYIIGNNSEIKKNIKE